MLVLKRTTIEAAIAQIEAENAKVVATRTADVKKAQDAALAKIDEILAAQRTAVTEAEAKLKVLLKLRAKMDVDAVSEALNDILSSTTRQSWYNYHLNPVGPHDHELVQLKRLRNLLKLIDGPELALTNAVAQKLLGTMDILDLL